MHRNMYTPPQRHKYASQLHPYTPFCPYMSAHMHAITSVYASQSIRIHVIHPPISTHTSPPIKRAYDPSYAPQYATESIRHRTPTTVNIVRFIVLAATPAD